VVGGTEVCHPVGEGCGRSDPHHVKGAVERLWVLLDGPWCLGLLFVVAELTKEWGRHGRYEWRPRLRHRRVVVRCNEEVM
jgi:hypothetical protein